MNDKDKHCVNYVYGLCKLENKCPNLHNDLFAPNKIEVFRCYNHKGYIERKIYTFDFCHFAVKHHYSDKFSSVFIKYGGVICKFDNGNDKYIRYNVDQILSTKKFIFYDLLCKYMIITNIFTLPEITETIVLLIDFAKELRTEI